jgi:hypothetical protein
VELHGLKRLPEAMELRFQGVRRGDGEGRDVMLEVGVRNLEFFFDGR